RAIVKCAPDSAGRSGFGGGVRVTFKLAPKKKAPAARPGLIRRQFSSPDQQSLLALRRRAPRQNRAAGDGQALSRGGGGGRRTAGPVDVTGQVRYQGD